jgi:hypothetical protein
MGPAQRVRNLTLVSLRLELAIWELRQIGDSERPRIEQLREIQRKIQALIELEKNG